MMNSAIVANINGGLAPGQKISSGLHSSMLMSDVDFTVTDVKTNTSSLNEPQKFLQKIGGKGSPNLIFNGHGKGVNFLDSNRNPQAKPVRVMNGNKNGIDSLEEEVPSPKVCLYLGKINSEWQQPHKIGAGLINLGNTCFMNTVLQCLTYCPPLANYLLHDSNHSLKCKIAGFCMMCELQRHMKRVIDRPGDIVKPVHIYQKLKSIAKHFQFGRQEDAHEFLRYVIDNMWKSCISNYEGHAKLDPASKETTVINKIFGGYHRSQVICLRCKEKNNTYDHFMDFILDVKQNVLTLEKALEKFIQPELLQNDNAYKCLHCKMKVSAQKKFTIYTPPNVATFQFKRFDYNRMCGGKITKHISYPEVLNLRPYMSNTKGGPIWYRLNAVLVHLGATCNSGHYYCFVRNSNGFWYVMDDTRVQQVSLNQVLNQVAYVLFYIRTNPSENLAKRPAESSSSSLKNNQYLKNGFIGSASCSVSPNPITRPSLNMKSSALPAISKLTVSSSPANGASNLLPNNAYQKRALQPLSQNREKVAFSLGSAKNSSKLPKTPTPNLPVNVVKNESALAKGLTNGNLLVPYIEDSSDSSDEESKNVSGKSSDKNPLGSCPSANLNKMISSSEKGMSNNNNMNEGGVSEIPKPIDLMEVKARSRGTLNFKPVLNCNNSVSSGGSSFSRKNSLCGSQSETSSQKLYSSQSSTAESTPKKNKCSEALKPCDINEEIKVSELDLSERKMKTVGPLFSLNRSLEPSASTSKVNATTQWSVTDINLRSPSVASGSSTNSVNSTTEWNVTEHDHCVRRKSEHSNRGLTVPIKNSDKSNKENKVGIDVKQQKSVHVSAHVDIVSATVKTSTPSASKEKLPTHDSNPVFPPKDEASNLKFRPNKSALNLNISQHLYNSSNNRDTLLEHRSPTPVKKTVEMQKSPVSKENENQIFLAQGKERFQSPTFQFQHTQSFLSSAQDTTSHSDAKRSTEAEKPTPTKRCLSDAVEDSCKERSSRFSNDNENSHGSVSKKFKADCKVKSELPEVIVEKEIVSLESPEKKPSLKASASDKNSSNYSGKVRTDKINAKYSSKSYSGSSPCLDRNSSQSRTFSFNKSVSKSRDSRSSPHTESTRQTSSQKLKKHADSDCESTGKGSSSSKSSLEYEWVEKTKETIEIEKTTNEVRSPEIPHKNMQLEMCSQNNVVSELQKHGHHMFGAEVGSWDNRKRFFDSSSSNGRNHNYNTYDEELDKGKVRKRKNNMFKAKYRNYNPFQDYQNVRNRYRAPNYVKWNARKYPYFNYSNAERYYGRQYQNGYGQFYRMHKNDYRHFHRR